MKTVPATEAKNRLGAILDDAQREPIVIRRQDRDIAVVLSMADYERLRSGNIQAFLDLRDQVAAEAAANGLTQERLNGDIAGDETAHQTDEQVGICCSPLAHSALNAIFVQCFCVSINVLDSLD